MDSNATTFVFQRAAGVILKHAHTCTMAIRQAPEWGLYFFAATAAKLLYEQGCSHTPRKNSHHFDGLSHAQCAEFILATSFTFSGEARFSYNTLLQSNAC